MERGASDKDVKRAYRQLSLQYHPDKNPDPAAAKYFAESISKAYKALTGWQCSLATCSHAADDSLLCWILSSTPSARYHTLSALH